MTRPAQDASLASSKQEYIWVIEHTAFELEKKFGAAFTETMKERHPAALNRFFLPDFSATALDPANTKVVDHGVLRQVSAHREDSQVVRHDADGFVKYLCAYLNGFHEISSLKVRVLDLHAEEQDPSTGWWRLTLYLRGQGADAEGSPMEISSKHRLRCRFSNDQEIAAGRIIEQWAVLSEKLRQSRQPLLQEATVETGLDEVDIQDNWAAPVDRVRQYHTQIAAEDFDRDGFLDVAVASASGRWRLLKSLQGKKFHEVTEDLGIPEWADQQLRSRSVEKQIYLATWIDIENDGYPDLILGDRVFGNQQGRGFVDVTSESGLYFNSNPRGCLVADYDCDGRLDLYVLYQHPELPQHDAPVGWVGDDESGRENQLWRNVGGGRFIDVTDEAKAGGGARQSFAAAWLHANEDHYPDLYIANDFGGNVLLVNDGQGEFHDASEPAKAADYATSMGVAVGDVTGDGASDIYVANMFSKMGRRIIAHVSADDYPPGVFEQIKGSCAGNRLYIQNDGSLEYQEVSEHHGVNQVGWAYAPALADFDSDGWLDIYATAGFLSFQRGKPDG